MKAAFYLLLPVLLLLPGCSNIRSKQVVGAEPVDLSQSIGDLELSSIAGEWVDHDGERFSVTISDAGQGEILYASLKEEDKDDEPAKLQLRRTGDHLFINFEPNEDGERIWLLFKAQGSLNQILYWQPDRERFRELIAEGRIKGRNDPAQVTNEDGELVDAKNPGAVIDDPDGAWVGKMAAGDFGVVFDWMNPTVLRKKTSDR